jgi:hypothetical protein
MNEELLLLFYVCGQRKKGYRKEDIGELMRWYSWMIKAFQLIGVATTEFNGKGYDITGCAFYNYVENMMVVYMIYGNNADIWNHLRTIEKVCIIPQSEKEETEYNKLRFRKACPLKEYNEYVISLIDEMNAKNKDTF